jgi:membrane protease YdiL (CAAX protease family)
MSSSSSKFHHLFVEPFLVKPTPKTLKRRIILGIGIPVWVFLGFMLAQAIVIVLIQGLRFVGVPLEQVNPALLQVIGGGAIYALAILIVLGVPWLVKRSRTTKAELGVHRLPTWTDILLVPGGAVVYLILTVIITSFAMNFFKFIDYDQTQDTGFTNLSAHTEYVLAFIMLVIIAPIAEELLFRGYLFGKIRKYVPLWLAIIVTSVVFAVVHGAWNVGLDVFALSIVLCLLRVISGSLWPSILLHMLKNSVAFFFLFIYPVAIATMGG